MEARRPASLAVGVARTSAVLTRRQSLARRELFCQAFCVSFNAIQATIEAGFSKRSASSKASQLMVEPEVQARIAEIIAARASAIHDRAFDVVEKVREVVDRCMQAAPVTIKGAPVEGQWQFDANAALRGLELLGKHEGLFATSLNVTVTEQKARETIKRAMTTVAKHVTPEVFRAIVADLEGAGDA